MVLFPFCPTGNSTTVAATTGNQRVALGAFPAAIQAEISLRVVNESASAALIAMGDITVDATSDAKVMSVPAGQERVFMWAPGASNVAVALRTGTGNVQVQLGSGV